MTIAYVTSPYTTAPTFNKAKFKPHDRQRLRLMKVTTSTNLNAIAKANQAVNVAYIPFVRGRVGRYLPWCFHPYRRWCSWCVWGCCYHR